MCKQDLAMSGPSGRGSPPKKRKRGRGGKTPGAPSQNTAPKKARVDVRDLTCYSCGRKGHISTNCPDKGLGARKIGANKLKKLAYMESVKLKRLNAKQQQQPMQQQHVSQTQVQQQGQTGDFEEGQLVQGVCEILGGPRDMQIDGQDVQQEKLEK
eukprot:TRINITY_DN11792_c0_g1_i9.p2 TRINITY_DN11792_c0_g1~~TRINITY_DN11792_c0_g1_i9.p2  ORF type:complete len:155 (-),score=22.52 TRINITY_DN11792_c0_g1_i9:23-487(-)